MTVAERVQRHHQQNSEWCAEYKNVCVQRPPDYSYYNTYTISWGNTDNYECYHKLGRGKYSEVFQGCNRVNNKKCIIKVLKPVKVEKIYREVKILQTLYGGPHIIKMVDILREPNSKTPCFIYEYMPTIETKVLF